MFKCSAALATSAAILLTAATPAFAGETLTLRSMIIADIGHDVNALSSGSKSDAKVVHMIPADYPPFELAAHIRAIATVQIGLNAKGAITGSSIMTSSGYPGLDKSALSAVRGATFVPASINGAPVGGTYAVDVTFDPDN